MSKKTDRIFIGDSLVCRMYQGETVIYDDYITFADPSVEEICIAHYDTNNDGLISYAEAAAVSSLSVYTSPFTNMGIQTFDELQYFIGLTSIGENAFFNCRSLTSVVIPDSVTSIGDYAFHECNSLTSVTIPNRVRTIGEGAFAGSGLTSVIIPGNVYSIGEGAFSCDNLASMSVENGNYYYDSRNNCNAIVKTSSNKLIFGCKNTIIPNSVTSIGKEAFFYCRGLTSLNIPSNVTTIDQLAFSGSGLTSMTIPNSVTYIGNRAFMFCRNLTSVTIGSGVTSIGKNAFVFCDSLTSVTMLSETPIQLTGDYTFGELSQNTIIYVPASALQDYLDASTWSYYADANRIQAISE